MTWPAPKATDIRVQWSPYAEAWKIRGRLDGPVYDDLEEALEIFGDRVAFRRRCEASRDVPCKAVAS